MKNFLIFITILLLIVTSLIVSYKILIYNFDKESKTINIESIYNLQTQLPQIAEKTSGNMDIRIEKWKVEEPQPQIYNLVSTNSMNFLLLGTDERNDEKSRSDTMILVHYNPEYKKAILVSIPRDTLVNIPNRGKDKINAAYAYGGEELAKRTLENLFDINIDNYIKVNFYGFMDIVNTIGGVKVNAKKDIDWTDGDFNKTYHIEQGEQVLYGEDLLMYARFRKDSQGDYGRMERQQEILLSIANELLDKENISKIPEIISIVSSNTQSDLDWARIGNLILQTDDLENITFETYTLKTHSEKTNGIWYEILDKENLNILSDKLNDM